MQTLLLARCHLGVIYPNLGVIWTWVCVMQLHAAGSLLFLPVLMTFTTTHTGEMLTEF